MTPSGREVHVKQRFPQTRDEARRVTVEVIQDLQGRGCECRDLKVEFVKPTVGAGYVQVLHDRVCRFAR